MKFLTLLFLLFLFPTSLVASTICKTDGYTIIYVNGILTSEQSAKNDRRNLTAKFQNHSNLQNTIFINGYNKSHLAGFGDLFKSVQQAYRGEGDVFVEDFDLQTILLQLHSQITTSEEHTS